MVNVCMSRVPPSHTSPTNFVGTLDNTPYLCVKGSIVWRENVLGGEARILEYTKTLAQAGGERVAEILGTKILENAGRTLTRCTIVNMAFPLAVKAEEDNVKARDKDLARVPTVAANRRTRCVSRSRRHWRTSTGRSWS